MGRGPLGDGGVAHPEVGGDGLPETRGHGHDAVEAVAGAGPRGGGSGHAQIQKAPVDAMRGRVAIKTKNYKIEKSKLRVQFSRKMLRYKHAVETRCRRVG